VPQILGAHLTKTELPFGAATAAALRDQGEPQLAREVEAFVRRRPEVATGNERVAKALLAQVAAQRSRTLSAEWKRSIEDRAR